MIRWQTIPLLLLLAGSSLASTNDLTIVGTLGKPIGTKLTIEGTFKAGKNSWFSVTKADGNNLSSPELIAISNLDPFAKIPVNTVCRFKGFEITYVVEDIRDPVTGRSQQQALSGRHFEFKITEVIVPDDITLRKEKSPNKTPAHVPLKAALRAPSGVR